MTWTYSPHRALLMKGGKTFSIVTPDGKNEIYKEQEELTTFLNFTRIEDGLLARVREVGAELPHRLLDWRLWINDPYIYLNELKNYVETQLPKS
jgi:hypothetical protein